MEHNERPVVPRARRTRPGTHLVLQQQMKRKQENWSEAPLLYRLPIMTTRVMWELRFPTMTTWELRPTGRDRASGFAVVLSHMFHRVMISSKTEQTRHVARKGRRRRRFPVKCRLSAARFEDFSQPWKRLDRANHVLAEVETDFAFAKQPRSSQHVLARKHARDRLV